LEAPGATPSAASGETPSGKRMEVETWRVNRDMRAISGRRLVKGKKKVFRFRSVNPRKAGREVFAFLASARVGANAGFAYRDAGTPSLATSDSCEGARCWKTVSYSKIQGSPTLSHSW